MIEQNRATSEAVMPNFLVTVCVSCTLWLALAGATAAQVPCTDWNTKVFFENAAAADVLRCLSAGANLEARTERGLTPLHMAAKYSTIPSVIAVLLDAGANLEARTIGGSTPLHEAVLRKTSSVIAVLLEAGANPEARTEGGFTPLHDAGRFSAPLSVVTALLDAGADVSARTDYGLTPLHMATRSPSVVTALVDAGANVNAQDVDGETPLHRAVRLGETPSVVTALLDAGADLEVRAALTPSLRGLTPLHLAALYAPSLIAVLLDGGADPRARAEDGRVPWDFVKNNSALKGTNVYWRLNEGRFE